MDAQLITDVPEIRARRSARAIAISSIGPLTTLAGLVWGVLQPYRITLLHPRGESFWWLVVEPPLLVALVGVLFHFALAPALLRDLADVEEGG